MHPFERPPAILRIQNWLGPKRVAWLLDYVQKRRDRFRPSGILDAARPTIDPTFRVSLKLAPIPDIAPEIEGRVRTELPRIISALGTDHFEPRSFEIELVAHGDGAFYKLHVDEKGEATKKRIVSVVYYFHHSPRAFSGGALRLHSLRASGAPGTFIDVEPENDSIVFFPSWFPHEVLPVSCPSGAFEDARFAINCWLHG